MTIPTAGAHVDQLLRQTRMHHVHLSSMADMKANILLTVSSVVLTIAIRYISDPALRGPTFVLIGFCLATIVMAIYSVMPHLPLRIRKRAVQPKAASAGGNVLFFGDFVHMSYEEFQSAMTEVMSSPERTYEAQLREIYLLGEFLARKKFRFLRMAYLTILAGFVTTTIMIAVGEFRGS